MNHATMNHATMNHATMNHAKMPHSPVTHSPVTHSKNNFTHSLFRYAIILGLAWVAFPSPQRAIAQSPVEYRLSFPDANQHYVHVDMIVNNSDQEQIDLIMATWTPGSYLIREYSRNIDRVTAENEKGEPLSVNKTAKNKWLVKSGSAKKVTISYRLYCHEMSVRTNWVEQDFAMLNGAPTFLSVPESLQNPHTVQLDLPTDWKQSSTALPPSGDKAHRYTATDFDHLVDSPILIGNPTIHSFKVGDRAHQLVNLGDDTYWDGAAAARDVEKIVAQHHKLWGTVPYPHYLFLNMITESGGGLEHDNSTLMMTGRWKYQTRSDYLSWLGLVSHEFFHTWNVRRLRPKVLKKYDYENENYTRSLWVIEGVTNYYDDLLLMRSKLCTQREYLAMLSKAIQSLQTTHGRLTQSLSDSSFDAWIKFYRPDENSSNTSISYYTKGSVVAFLLDAKIRESTKGEKSLDDVMRLMYERYVNEGYTPADFRSVVNEVASSDLDAWFTRCVDSTDELDYQAALGFYGLLMPGAPPQSNATPEGESDKNGKKVEEKTAVKPKAQKVWLGVSASSQNGHLTISRVKRDSPAAKAGLNVDDELIAIDGYRAGNSWQTRLSQYNVGESIKVLISRRQKLMELPVVLEGQTTTSWRLTVNSKSTPEQKKQLAKWLGTPIPKTKASPPKK